jgi:hypothetical protein
MLDVPHQPLRADPPATRCRDRKGLNMDDFSLLDLFFTRQIQDMAEREDEYQTQRDRLLVG